MINFYCHLQYFACSSWTKWKVICKSLESDGVYVHVANNRLQIYYLYRRNSITHTKYSLNTANTESCNSLGHHRIIESLEQEETLKNPTSLQWTRQPMLDQVAQGPIQPCLESLQGQNIHLGNLFLTTLTVKDFFLISILNLLFLNLKPFPLVLSEQTLIKSLYHSFL